MEQEQGNTSPKSQMPSTLPWFESGSVWAALPQRSHTPHKDRAATYKEKLWSAGQPAMLGCRVNKVPRASASSSEPRATAETVPRTLALAQAGSSASMPWHRPVWRSGDCASLTTYAHAGRACGRPTGQREQAAVQSLLLEPGASFDAVRLTPMHAGLLRAHERHGHGLPARTPPAARPRSRPWA